jgi:hypothetical protein
LEYIVCKKRERKKNKRSGHFLKMFAVKSLKVADSTISVPALKGSDLKINYYDFMICQRRFLLLPHMNYRIQKSK